MDNKQAMELIRGEYPEWKVTDLLDEEILEWVDENWEEDGFESEYDWYMEYRNGEAETVVLEGIMNWFEHTHEKVAIQQRMELHDLIKEQYECLYPA